MSWTSMFKWDTFREILLPSSGNVIYVARWWEKYLSKHSPLKHTCLWHDKLIILWILNRQAKISLSIFKFYLIKTEYKSIYYHFRSDHESSSSRKLARNKWICWEICDFLFVINLLLIFIVKIYSNRIKISEI